MKSETEVANTSANHKVWAEDTDADVILDIYLIQTCEVVMVRHNQPPYLFQLSFYFYTDSLQRMQTMSCFYTAGYYIILYRNLYSVIGAKIQINLECRLNVYFGIFLSTCLNLNQVKSSVKHPKAYR